MVGGKVIGIVRGGTMPADESKLNVEDGRDRCVTHCRDHGLVRIDDIVWWQGGWVLWTPQPRSGDRCGIDFDIKLDRLEWPHGTAAAGLVPAENEEQSA